MILFFLSFLILFFSEICGTLHGIYTIKKKKHMVALFDGISSALWCLKIVVTVSQPLTVITAFIGAYLGVLAAFYLDEKYSQTMN